MGYLSRQELASDLGVKFSDVDVDPALLYGPGYNLREGTAWTPPLSPRVSRTEAMSVPAVKRVRDLICSFGSLPLELVDSNNTPVSPARPLFVQPEAGVPASVTWTNLAEDLLFEKVGWLRISSFDWTGRPFDGVRLDPRTVTVQQDAKVYATLSGNYGTRLEWLPDEHLIRFDSPNDALLRSGSRAIRSLLRLENAASNMTDGTPPADYFTPADGVDLADEFDPTEMLTEWKVARRARSTAWVPGAVKYNVGGFNPKDLQLAEAREFAITEIARLAGIDNEDLGVSTTSRTYFNAFDRTQAFIQFTLMPYITAIESRLSMDDVTPKGYRARFKLDDLFRADTLSRYQAYDVGLRVGAITKDEIRTDERRPPLTASQQTELTPPAPAADDNAGADSAVQAMHTAGSH